MNRTDLSLCQAQVVKQNHQLKTRIQTTATMATSDIAILTSSVYRRDKRKGSQQSLRIIVCDKDMRVKYERDLPFNEDKTKLLRCCFAICPYKNVSHIFMCFGNAFYRYKTLSGKLDKLSSLHSKRTGYCLLECFNRCYVIGGEHNGRKVLQIEEFDIEKQRSKWKKVASLPRECLPMQSSCSVYKDDCVYIFCALVDEANNIKKDRTGVYVFYPARKTVEKFMEINFWFRQFKSCTLDSCIFIVSDDGRFIRFYPDDGKVIECQDQMVKCRDVGIYSTDRSMCLVGGIQRDGTLNNVIKKFCTIANAWEISPTHPPNDLTVHGVCELKI